MTNGLMSKVSPKGGAGSGGVKGPGPGGRTKSVAREYAEAIILAIILALFIRTFVVQAFKIPSGSMLPTLQIGDHILVLKSIYGVRLPFLNTLIIPVKPSEAGRRHCFCLSSGPDQGFHQKGGWPLAGTRWK